MPYHASYFNPTNGKRYDAGTVISAGPPPRPFEGHARPLLFEDRCDGADASAWKDFGAQTARKDGRLCPVGRHARKDMPARGPGRARRAAPLRHDRPGSSPACSTPPRCGRSTAGRGRTSRTRRGPRNAATRPTRSMSSAGGFTPRPGREARGAARSVIESEMGGPSARAHVGEEVRRVAAEGAPEGEARRPSRQLSQT